MSRRTKPVDPTLSLAHFFGAELRRRREQKGWSQQDLADRVLHGVDLVRKVETAERFPSLTLVSSFDDVLGANGALIRTLPLLEREHALRSRRQSDRGGVGVVAADSDAAVLDWLIEPGRDSLAAERVDDADLVMLDRLRTGDGSVGAGGTHPRVVARIESGLDDLAARAPGLAVGFLELAGYQSVDLGADDRAQRYYLRALRITSRAGDRRYGGYLVGVSIAHLALHVDDAAQAERFATAALRGTRSVCTPTMRAAFHAVLARAHARRGDEPGCTAALLQADIALERSVPTEEPEWIRYFGEADLADEKAHCLFDLGRDAAAQREASGAVAVLDPSRVRRLAMDTALQASAMARSGEVEGACVAGRAAVGFAARTASYRSVQRVTQMLAQLQPYTDLPVVRELVDHAAVVLPPPPMLRRAGR